MSNDKKEAEPQNEPVIPEISSLNELEKLFKEKARRTAVIDETIQKLSELEIKLVGLKEDEKTAGARISELVGSLYGKYAASSAQADANALPVNTLLAEPTAAVVGAGDPPPAPILTAPAGPWTSLLATAKITKS